MEAAIEVLRGEALVAILIRKKADIATVIAPIVPLITATVTAGGTMVMATSGVVSVAVTVAEEVSH